MAEITIRSNCHSNLEHQTVQAIHHGADTLADKTELIKVKSTTNIVNYNLTKSHTYGSSDCNMNVRENNPVMRKLKIIVGFYRENTNFNDSSMRR